MRIPALFALIVLFAAWPARARDVDSIQMEINTRSATERSAHLSRLYSELGTAYYRMGRFGEAVDAFENALENPCRGDLRRHVTLYLAKSFESSDRPDKALAAYSEAVAADPKNWKRHRDLGRMQEMGGQLRSALASYAEAARLHPAEPSLWLDQGRAWRKIGLYNDAESALRKALALGSPAMEAYDELSLVLEGRGRFAAALAMTAKTLLDGSSDSAWGRHLYLAVLAGDGAAVERTLAHFRGKGTPADTLAFYEDLARAGTLPVEDRRNITAATPELRDALETVHP